MRIGIYNRYWATRGGGERYAGVIAEALSRDHEVELIGSEPVDADALARHLGLDLSRVRWIVWPEWTERNLSPLTADYDLFINCTYLSRLRSKADRSAYVVLFPQRTLPRSLVRTIQTILDHVLVLKPRPILPLTGFHPRDSSGSLWSGEQAVLGITRDAFNHGEATISFHPATPWPLREALRNVRAPGLVWKVRRSDLIVQPSGPLRDGYRVELTCKTFRPSELGKSSDSRLLGVCMAAYDSPWLRRARRFAERLRGRLDAYDPNVPETYDLLISISEFTRSWVRKRWGQDSVVLAPPVDISRFKPPRVEDKEKIILSVGRFFHGSHNKKHLEMVKVFRTLCDRGDVPSGWEYHLVGNLHRNREVDLEYFTELQELAKGYPVRILVDLPLNHLVDEYRRAFIFWHAAGWGEDDRRRPDKLEHFGLTTCEAMSSGCIPIVIAKAGQLEIVEHGKNGFLFHDRRELEDHTRRLIRGYRESWTRDLMHQARHAVEKFGTTEFKQRLSEILASHRLLS